MNDSYPSVRAAARTCVAHWHRLQEELADLGGRIRDAVVEVLTRSLAAAAGDVLRGLMRPPAWSRPTPSYARTPYGAGDEWDNDDVVAYNRPAPFGAPRQNLWIVALRTAAWWLLRRGPFVPAFAAGLLAAVAAWAGAGDLIRGCRQIADFILLFRNAASA